MNRLAKFTFKISVEQYPGVRRSGPQRRRKRFTIVEHMCFYIDKITRLSNNEIKSCYKQYILKHKEQEK